jgi:LPXTG-motif cell wall-anchored protein
VLTPNIDGGTWNWDKRFFSATFNSPATFTGLKAGVSTITYTVDGQTASYVVTVKESELPSTGQDFTWAWLLGGLSAALTFALTIGLKKVRG